VRLTLISQLTVKDTRAVSILLDCHHDFFQLLSAYHNTRIAPTRKQLGPYKSTTSFEKPLTLLVFYLYTISGLLLKRTGNLWRQCMFLSICETLPELPLTASRTTTDEASTLQPITFSWKLLTNALLLASELLQIPSVVSCLEIIKLIETYQLIGVWDLRPVLDVCMPGGKLPWFGTDKLDLFLGTASNRCPWFEQTRTTCWNSH